MQIEFHIEGGDRLQAALIAAPEVTAVLGAEAMTKSVFLVESEVKARTPRVTGRLFASVNGRLVTPFEGRINTNVHYGGYVEEGRGPIVAKGKMLKFKNREGVTIYRHSVGPAAGRHMFREGLEASKDRILEFFKDAAHRATEFIARAG